LPPEKVRPRIAPRPDLTGARGTSARAAISFQVVTFQAVTFQVVTATPLSNYLHERRRTLVA